MNFSWFHLEFYLSIFRKILRLCCDEQLEKFFKRAQFNVKYFSEKNTFKLFYWFDRKEFRCVIRFSWNSIHKMNKSNNNLSGGHEHWTTIFFNITIGQWIITKERSWFYLRIIRRQDAVNGIVEFFCEYLNNCLHIFCHSSNPPLKNPWNIFKIEWKIY